MPLLQKVCILFLLANEVLLSASRKEVGKRSETFDRLFDVYDPTFLSGVWPKIGNGVHLTLEQACWDDLTVLFRDLADGRAWAYEVVDASGRYPSAMFSGHRFWMGSKEQCLRMNTDAQEEVSNDTVALLRKQEYLKTVLRRQKYFDAETNEWRWSLEPTRLVTQLAAADRQAPLHLAYTVLQLQLNYTRLTMLKTYDITLGVCLPLSCPPEDIEAVVNFSIMLSDNLKTNQTTPRSVKIISAQKIQDYQMENDAGAISLIAISCFLILIVLIATAIDLDLLKCKYKNQSMSFDLPTYNNSETKLVDDLKRKFETKSVDDILRKHEKCVDDILNENVNMNLMACNLPRSYGNTITDLGPSGSCNRCGKYKRQCPNSGKQVDNSTACPRVKYSSFASLSTEDRRKNSFFCRLLLCFSLCYTWRRLFNKNTANQDLALVHMVKILATFWLVFIQVAVMVGYISENVGDINESDNLYRNILTTGTIAFDTMFFVSGLFSAHHFFYLKSRYSVEQLVSFGGLCGDLMHFFCTVTNRVIRLVPSYAYAVLAGAVAARATRGAALSLADEDHYNCDVYWWRNLLYVSNWYPEHEQCLQISWYLSVETQLHAVGAAACVAAGGARPRLVGLAVTALALAAAAAHIGGTYREGAVVFADTYSAYGSLIVGGWARVVPYCAGLLTGWLVHEMRGRLRLTKVLSCVLWGASLALLVGGAAATRAQPQWLAAGARLAWPCALLWPALAACTQHAEWWRGVWGSCGAALGRLCGSAILLHYIAARLLLLSPDTALCSHLACVWMYWAGTMAATLVASLILCLLIELPCCGLFRRLSDVAA